MLFTIGYEGADLQDFLASLKRVGVNVLLDIRDVPVSRRKGFSKNALAAALEGAGIEYVHLKGLGDPKDGREAARSGDFPKFRKIFNAHLKTEKAQQHLADAIEIVGKSASCLLCYERDPINCHRSIVASKISAILETKVQHLGVQEGIAERLLAAE